MRTKTSRINFTGKKLIVHMSDKPHFRISKNENANGEGTNLTLTFEEDFLPYTYGADPNSKVHLDITDGNKNRKRFNCGTLIHPVPLSEEDISDFQRSKSFHAQLKLIDPKPNSGKVLASSKLINLQEHHTMPGSGIPLIARDFSPDLGNALWDVEVPDDGIPILWFNKKLFDSIGQDWTYSPLLRESIYYGVVTKVLMFYLIVGVGKNQDDENSDQSSNYSYRNGWLEFTGVTEDEEEKFGPDQASNQMVQDLYDIALAHCKDKATDAFNKLLGELRGQDD